MSLLAAAHRRNAGGSGYDSDADDYFARVLTAGYSFSDPDKAAINTFIVDAKGDGFWTKINWCVLLYADLNVCLTPMKVGGASDPMTNIGGNLVSGDIVTGGLKGDGSSKGIDTGLNPSTTLTLNDTHVAGFITARVGSQSNVCGVSTFGSPALMINLRENFGTGSSAIYRTNESAAIPGVNGPQFGIGSRTAIDEHKSYRNGTLQTTRSETNAHALPNGPLHVLGTNNLSTTDSFSNVTICWVSVGAGLTGTDASNYNTRIQTLCAALGLI